MQVLELAGNAARDNNKTRIVSRHIQLAVRNYEELSKLLGDVTITNGGMMPNIHNLLHPKKTGGRKICQLLSNVPIKKRDSGTGTFASSSDKSRGIKSTSIPSMSQTESTNIHMETSHPNSVLSETAHSAIHLSDARENGVVLLEDEFLGQETPLTIDQIDLLREHQKILSSEVALHTSALKRLSEEAAQNPRKEHLQELLEEQWCPCDRDLLTDVTRYSEMIINPEIPACAVLRVFVTVHRSTSLQTTPKYTRMTQLTSPMVLTTITVLQVIHSTCRNHTAAAIFAAIRKHKNWFSCCFIQYGHNMDTGLNRERVGLEMGELGNSMTVDFPVDFTSIRHLSYTHWMSFLAACFAA
ncbi:kinesin-like protein KIN-7K [Forsythia ovata]|uniref:Kinesin-like protein KIN-7K n=1 Tax=Forsythia ovata TaxID=205694 RepID=A0ABD1VGA1_9LAMI